MWKFHEIQMIIPITVIFLSGLLSVHAKDCSRNVTVIYRGKEIFNETNYDDVCLGDIDSLENYNEKVAPCGPYVINPKCICAYDMYVKGINDLCKNRPVAVEGNGSILHTTNKFCKEYSHSKNGPCQNGGELIVNNDLALDARCTCKAGFSGDLCDTVEKRIACHQWTLNSYYPNCSTKFIASNNRYCLLSFKVGKMYRCDTQKDATDDMEECKPAPDRIVGKDASKASSLSKQDSLVLMTMCFIFHWIS